MIILDSRISHVRRARDFDRVEATVTLWIKRAGQPVRPATIRTNTPVRGHDPLRLRLIWDAGQLIDRIVTTPVEMPRAA